MSAASGGGGLTPSPTSQVLPDDDLASSSPGQVSGHSAWAGVGALGGANTRTFEQIIEQEKKNRNIIEIHLTKDPEKIQQNPQRPLTFDELGELIFDVIKINPEDCITFDYNTGRFDTKHIQLKPSIQADQFVTTNPIQFKGHLVSVCKQLNNITRVTFKNVPLNVPNEEILQLCNSYGKPLDNKVYFETLTNQRNKGMRGSTRFVDMELKKGASMMNYYWLEGPLSGDQGRRVLVLHNGQVSQCSHCFRKAGPGGCPAGGNGKACNLMGTPRGKMLHYMQSLKAQVGYVSLKTKYMEKQARNFPPLPGFDTDIRSNMEESSDIDFEDIIPMNPIEEKDNKIANLEKKLENLKEKETEINQLKEALSKSSADLRDANITNKTVQRKLTFTKNATEQRLLDSISNPDGFIADPVLIGVYSATLDEKEIKFEDSKGETDSEVAAEDSKGGRSRMDNFLQSMEEKLDPSNSEHKERFMVIKNQIIEKVKHTQHSRERSRSGSIGSRGDSKKRDLSSESKIQEPGKSPVRARTSGIPKVK